MKDSNLFIQKLWGYFFTQDFTEVACEPLSKGEGQRMLASLHVSELLKS